VTESPPPDAGTAAPKAEQAVTEPVVPVAPEPTTPPATEAPAARPEPAPAERPEAIPPPIEVPPVVEVRPQPGGHRIATVASVVAAFTGIVVIPLMIVGECRAVREAGERRQEVADRRQADSLANLIAESTQRAVQRSAATTDHIAAVQDSGRREQQAAVAKVKRDDELAAVEAERTRQNRVTIRDGELRTRFRLLHEALGTISLVNPVRQEASAYERATEAWHAFLRARDPRSPGIEGQTTHTLMQSVYSLDNNNEQVRQARLDLERLLGRDDESLYSPVWTSNTIPDTMMMTVKDPVAGRPHAKLPVEHVFRMLAIPRWGR